MNNRKPNRTKQVVDALGRRIVSGDFRAGSLLPSETELEREYAVSRTVIREAAKILSAKGLVTVRQRHGTSVNARELWSWLDGELIGWLSMGRIAKEELFAFSEVRRIIEPEAAALAALRASDDQRKNILNAYERMVTDQANPEQAVAADKEFHLAILEATQNPVLHSLRQAIEAILDAVFPHTVNAYAHNLENHAEVARAIARGDTEAARTYMRILLSETTDFLDKSSIMQR